MVTVSGVVRAGACFDHLFFLRRTRANGVFYFNACKPTGGTGNYQWSLRAGALPSGLSLTPGPGGGIIMQWGLLDGDSNPYYYVVQFPTIPLFAVDQNQYVERIVRDLHSRH